MAYNKEKKKALGAFYTPQVLSDLLARLLVPLCKASNSFSITALDPATGDSILLLSFASMAKECGINFKLLGIDTDRAAINKSKKQFNEHNCICKFVNTDALYPYGGSTPTKGWDTLMKKYIPDGIDLIVSNPPWGTDTTQYPNLARDFKTATGQFDIYDLFIETIVTHLKPDGVYGIIVPDSIFCQEHQKTREILLTNTTIKGIIRLGEGFFSDVNFAVSILYGIKNTFTSSKVLCSHLNNADRKNILAGKADINTIIRERSIEVPIKQMISSNYSFNVDVSSDDAPILQKLRKNDIIKMYASCQRGIELSKKGVVLQCTQCGKWFPFPRKKKEITKCPHCKSNVTIIDANSECIISDKKGIKNAPLLVGEDINRFFVTSGRYIRCGLEGINYKSQLLYQGNKVVVRKTGVGITAGIDYNNSMTNQVVYIIKPKETINPLITAEVITAILCSRLITYVIIKEKGSIGWTSNPYLSQKDVYTLPFPRLDFGDNKTTAALRKITELVREYSQMNKNVPQPIDAEIEKNIAYLFSIGKNEYEIVFKTISQVEQMIPFSRLLNIKTEDIFQDGI